MTSVTLTTRSGNPNIDGLLADHQWSRSVTALDYGFPSGGAWSGYEQGGEPYANFEPLNGAQQAVAAAILGSVARFTALNFLPASALNAQGAELRFGMTGATEAAHAYTPYSDEIAGDVWFSGNGDYDAPAPGNYAYLGFLHEIGHALGLKHPHEAERHGRMPLATDNMNHSVMSYRSYPGMALDGDGLTNGDFGFPQTFMMFDIAALQHLYGADFGTESGNTVYKWGLSSGQMTVNGATRMPAGAGVVYMTLWDGGGIDTYDFSGYRYGVTIDLNPGAWSGAISNHLAADLGDGRRAPGSIANALLYKGDPRSLIENATGGLANDKLFGNQAANTLAGGGGLDWLDGRGGADRMIGGAGNDWYIVNDSGDRIVENADGGSDTVEATAVAYTLDANVETVIGRSTAGGQRLTGNALANRINGSKAGPNVLDGGAGVDYMVGGPFDDIYHVDDPRDRLYESYGNGSDLVLSSVSYVLYPEVDHLTLTGARALNATGNASYNRLTGNSAANRLDGLGGNDLMRGMDGDDTYIVQAAGDRAVEDSAAGGIDTVLSAVSYTIGDNVENLTLTGGGETTGTGNALANILTGNAKANSLNGGSGNDRLDGGLGADRMNGGNGDDVFIVDHAADKPAETSAAGGIDRVESSVSFALGAYIENLTLTGTVAVQATGNGLANRLIGNAAANSLNGGGGADTLEGRGGNDIYHVDHAGDRAVEVSATGGIDLVRSSVSFALGAHVENLTLTGGAAADGTGNGLANVLTGNGAANLLKGGGGGDTLVGGGGDDRLSGGAGGDLLRGGDGGDSFLFDAPPGNGNLDHVADLVRGTDRIVLDNAVFQSLADGALAASAFRVGGAARDASDRILYNPSTGALYYDPDGAGGAAAIRFAMLDDRPALLAASDFFVI